MVHGYHVVFGTYGFWLPNDLRGSWSDFVAAWELRLQGPATKGIERLELTEKQQQWQRTTKLKLQYPEVFLDGQQALAVACGFKNAIKKSEFTIWACSILPQHVHLVIARHRFKVEYIAGLLKGEATKALNKAGRHPLGDHQDKDGNPPTPWNVKSYHGFLESEQEIEDAMAYVIENPIKEGKRRQEWSFITPFAGLEPGWTTYQ
jgi:REP element-mobilizing transposase RayT